MAFWDGHRWVRPAAGDAVGGRRPLVDWIATAVLLVGLLLIVLMSTQTRATGPELVLTPPQGASGTSVTAVGSGLPAGVQATITFDGNRISKGNLRSDGKGEVRLTFTVPATAPGEHTVAVTAALRGQDRRTAQGATSASATFKVVVPTAVEATASPAATPSGDPTDPDTPDATPPAGPSATPTATPDSTTPPIPRSTPVPTSVPTAKPTAVPTAAPTAVPPPPSSNVSMLFGLGPTVDSSKDAALTRESRVGMLTAWYNSPNDLGWMTDAYHRDMYAKQYAAGKAMHLIVWTGDAETSFSTKYGTACGRAYPLSTRFMDDIKRVAGAFAGSGALYVTLFTEFQTFPCTDNAWNPNAATNAYLRALKDRYLEARAAIRSVAPNARVSLGWGGWQTRWDDAAKGGGRSMFQHFGDVMGASDFQSFQAMQSDTNVNDVRAMTRTLGAWGPVMLAHYKPNNGSQATFDADTRAMLTDSYLAELQGHGLFAWSFMDQANLNASSSSYTFVRDALKRFGR